MKTCGVPIVLDDREPPSVSRRLEDAHHQYTKKQLLSGDLAWEMKGGVSVGLERKTWSDLIGTLRTTQWGSNRLFNQLRRLVATYDIPLLGIEGGYRVYQGQRDIGELDAHGTWAGGLIISGRRLVAPGGVYGADNALLRAQQMGVKVVHFPEPELFGMRLHALINYMKDHLDVFRWQAGASSEQGSNQDDERIRDGRDGQEMGGEEW